MHSSNTLQSYWRSLCSVANKGKGEFLLTAMGNLLYLSQAVIQTKIFASLFSTSVYGEWALLISVYTLISMLPFTALNQGIYRIAYKCRSTNIEKQLYSSLFFVQIALFFLYGVILFVINCIQGDAFFADKYFVPFCLYAFSEILKITWITVDNSFRRRKHVLLLYSVDFFSRFFLFGVLYFLDAFTITNVLWVLVFTNAIILLLQKDYFRQITVKLNKEVCYSLSKEVVIFSLPLLIWAVFSWMQNMISRWYLDMLLDLEAVAMYAILTALASFLPNILYGIINSYIMPIVYERDKEFNRTMMLKFLAFSSVGFIIYFVFVCFLGKYIIIILSDQKYLPVLKYLPVMTMSSILYVLAQLSTVELFRKGKTRKLLMPSILPGLFMATVGYFLILKFSFIGAVMNYIFGQSLYSFYTFFVVFKKENLHK